ncbi:MAG: HypC/HybG/HupF family hydrogenase formation chaperone [Nitrospira sp.]|nr:HypC/HybG/HupF family hydrogenase formation chaperone [Nitrospira sp.]
MCLAVPGQVLQIADDPLRTATVSFGGVTKTVSLALVPDATVGDYVMVHVGFAISRLNEEEARRTLEAYAELAAMEVKDRVEGEEQQSATGREGVKSR